MMDIEKIIDRVKRFKSLKRDADVADLLGNSPRNFCNKKKRGTLITLFINWGINENVDLHWLLTGEGNKFLSSKPPNSIHEQAAPFGLGKIDSETAELLRMSNEILTSDTAFAKSLALSIRTFYLAMNPSKIRQSDSLAKKTEIIKHAVPHIIRAVKLSYYLGLRPGAVELLSLTWEDVNWDSQTILIRSADKGGPRSRQVAIHEDFLEELGSWYRQDEKSGPVVHYQGRAIKYIGRAWRKTLARAGIIRRIRPYDLRHGFITAALEAGADLKALSEIVGSRPETIMRHYQHVSKKLHRETVAKICFHTTPAPSHNVKIYLSLRPPRTRVMPAPPRAANNVPASF